MKMFLLVLAICVTVAFGDQPQEIGDIHIGNSQYEPGQTDALLYAQTYDHDLLTNGWHSAWIVDDFELSADADVDQIIVWMAYVDVPIVPEFIDLAIYQDAGDNDPNNATQVWAGTASCTNVDTGDAFSGGTIPIYETTCDLTSPVSLTGGDRYWCGVSLYSESEGWNAYMCVFPMAYYTQVWLNEGEPPWVAGEDIAVFGYKADMFFEIHGTIGALENSTWGNIKADF